MSEANKLGKELRRKIRQDRRKRVYKVAINIEESLNKGDIIGAFGKLKSWYRKFTGQTFKPSKGSLDGTRTTYEKLFTTEEMTDEMPYEFEYEGGTINDEKPEDEETPETVMKRRRE